MRITPDMNYFQPLDGNLVPADATRMQLEHAVKVLREIDGVCTDFEDRLRHGGSPDIVELTSIASSDVRLKLLRELLAIEMEFRAKRGDTPSLDEYRRRFPDHSRLTKFLYFGHFIPARIGEFPIQRLLGRGSFGHVYRGWDSRLSRDVAIKVFRRDPEHPPSSTNLLLEARAAARLNHPGVVAVYSVSRDADGDEFLVLEYVEGCSLEDMLRAKSFTPNESASLLLTVVQALQHAHGHGLVHRDLKPANILLDHVQRPRVTDFGLALSLSEVRRLPAIAGTLSYMAPEQANGETHRLDARTDLWAVGVVLYRMLSGCLPFSGRSNDELLNNVRHAEPIDLLEHDPTIPLELARIVCRCLTKQMSERYQSAGELADDLNSFLPPTDGRSLDQESPGELADKSLRHEIIVVPKGLRHYDACDREFFLSLVPGPRDRHGIPQAVRFWVQRLREVEPHQTFRVGLLCGPSGCGKSSLIRAGILPSLPGNVRHIVIEATRNETELRLARELHRHFPELSFGLALTEMVGELREGSLLQPGEKLVIVIDQFEQWLHGRQNDATAELAEAFRQCDGGRMQGLVLVRDEFWMQASRFFRRLDVPLVEGFNSAPVDLFDHAHAKKVLVAFGVAHGRLEGEGSKRTPEQERFIETAIAELSEGGWIVPVRLCVFTEMVKARTWSAVTLRELGKPQDWGSAFLHEAFDGKSAAPMHRIHRKGARGVLERLLPPPGTDIRGHSVPESDLRSASGYENHSAEFATLMRCLDHDLRLITPSESEPAATVDDPDARNGEAHDCLYQLTHDSLVGAIRGWLNQFRRRTFRGRAELRLAESAADFDARPGARQLPSLREWLTFFVLTRRRRWRIAERRMMHTAGHRHIVRLGLAIVAILILSALVYDRMVSIHVDGLVQTLVTSGSRDVPDATRSLESYRHRVGPILRKRLAVSNGQGQRVRILLGMVAVGDPQSEELFTHLIDCEPPLAASITDVLRHFDRLEDLRQRLWSIATSAEGPRDERLRACMALAHLPLSEDANLWQTIGPDVGHMILRDVAENPQNFGVWIEGLTPARQWLVGPLRQSLHDRELREGERTIAANILAQYHSDDARLLMELALDCAPRQFEVFAKAIGQRGETFRLILTREASTPFPAEASDEEKDGLARRQANAALLLLRVGHDQQVWRALEHHPDPRTRSFLIHHLAKVAGRPSEWLGSLTAREDSGIRQALVLVLGSAESRSAASHQELADELLDVYRTDPDPGVHSGSAWALRQLGFDDLLDQATAELAHLGMRPGYGWYVTQTKLTMVIFPSPGQVQLGSPDTETGRDASDEALRTCNVDWSFAISATEVTQAQFLELRPDYKEYLNEHARLPTCPANAVTWLDAIKFCRRLSEREGVMDSEMVVPPVENMTKGPYQDCLSRSGFRLPLEVEWEVACRAGTESLRFYGSAPDLLSDYCCYIGNSDGRTWSVGTGWPNQVGLFDMFGNVAEWCYDRFQLEPSGGRPASATGYSLFSRYALRGNDYRSSAGVIRAANRRSAAASRLSLSYGFRVAHTVRHRDISK